MKESLQFTLGHIFIKKKKKKTTSRKLYLRCKVDKFHIFAMMRMIYVTQNR